MAIVPGLRIGHATDRAARTGCTVLLGPFRASVHVAGHATGSRELDSLSPLHIVPRVDALLLTGGSAFGLAAADGVVAWLEERGQGFDVGVARVPIVPAAVVFDLMTASRRPDAAMGRAACDAATDQAPEEGAVGAGTGATVGKLRGPEHASRGGFGCWAEPYRAHSILGLAVVNALGNVVADDGRVIAGSTSEGGGAPDAGALESALPRIASSWRGAMNTTLAVVATDAPLDASALQVLARMTVAALARRIAPVFTPFDGDIVFALSTAPTESTTDPRELLMLGTAATHAVEQAIVRAVTV
jgi:L-aminopeptidase/D-esterase-like protein